MQFITGILFIALQLHLLNLATANSPRPVTLPADGCNCDRTHVSPVCSNSSFTYGNKCQLRCESQKRVSRGESPIIVAYPGECTREGCICTADVRPVCGTDGYTYENQCRLSCNSDKMIRLGLDPIYMKHFGKCTSECKCPIDIIPSCGSDGVTYSSSCLIDCINVKRSQLKLPLIRRKPGACPTCNCRKEVDKPVCGTDGHTYRNQCELKCESKRLQSFGWPAIGVQSKGKCPEVSCICPQYIDPVCGTNGQTYNNECELQCANKRSQMHNGPPISLAYKGSCRAPTCMCSPTISPVCGSNNKSYRNICWLNCASKININNGLSPIYLKANEACYQESCLCPAIWMPVCGSDGKTYGTECALQCYNGRRTAIGLDPVIKLYNGECQPCICNQIRDPVCGSDGKTYGNPCELGCENGRRKMRGLPPLTSTKGECGCFCALVYEPVCASNFKTYGNKCALGCVNKKRAEDGLAPLTVVWNGECGCRCSDTDLPVCGTDRRSYRNVCWLSCAHSWNISHGWPAVYLSHNGPC